MEVREIERKIDTLSKNLDRQSRKELLNIKKKITSVSSKMAYESNFDKRMCVANYNKLLKDVEDLDKQKFSLIFIHVPNINISHYIPENNQTKTFLSALKEDMSNYFLAKRRVYVVSDYLVLLSFKEDANETYQKIKTLKDSNSCWFLYQMTFIKYKKFSSKINKNVGECIKKAYNIFSGTPKEVSWDDEI